MEMITPSRIGRDGLRLGVRAPGCTLPDAEGREYSPQHLADRKTLLVLTQSGCGSCGAVVPELIGPSRSDIRPSTPFALVIDEGGTITSKRLFGSRQYLGFVLQGAGQHPEHKEEQVPDTEGAGKLEGSVTSG